MTVSWEISEGDMRLVQLVLDRAGRSDDRALKMDLVAAHANGCPMDFARLLAAPDFTFWHDLNGIQDHMDRETGRLSDLFSPRCHS